MNKILIAGITGGVVFFLLGWLNCLLVDLVAMTINGAIGGAVITWILSLLKSKA